MAEHRLTCFHVSLFQHLTQRDNVHTLSTRREQSSDFKVLLGTRPRPNATFAFLMMSAFDAPDETSVKSAFTTTTDAAAAAASSSLQVYGPDNKKNNLTILGWT